MENIETERSGLLSGIRTSGLKMFARISDPSNYFPGISQAFVIIHFHTLLGNKN